MCDIPQADFIVVLKTFNTYKTFTKHFDIYKNLQNISQVLITYIYKQTLLVM